MSEDNRTIVLHAGTWSLASSCGLVFSPARVECGELHVATANPVSTIGAHCPRARARVCESVVRTHAARGCGWTGFEDAWREVARSHASGTQLESRPMRSGQRQGCTRNECVSSCAGSFVLVRVVWIACGCRSSKSRGRRGQRASAQLVRVNLTVTGKSGRVKREQEREEREHIGRR